MFNPSNYLVSPFNSTEKFIAGKYFLTVQQESICKDVQKRIDDSITNFIAIGLVMSVEYHNKPKRIFDVY